MLIAPVIPPQAPVHDLIAVLRHPAAAIAAPVDGELVYGMCAVGAAGRIQDRHTMTALGWAAGTRLGIRCGYHGVLLVHPKEYGTVDVADAGFFRVPYRQRRAANLHIGDRVLLVAHPPRHLLTIHPPTALHPLFGNPRAWEPMP